ncbi:Major Facilitator Superfamily (MFS) [Trachipleistophora hominis]|uniref:Major Facilitator Superfamily (MFS) n=1 Tax=Trachipleistophora hominis TaxID=72359 RepID=L7JZ46_TRAHO|nr:Major Facilitator Superfamily (MFS) [Trachipleistophora hominis]
MPKYYTRRRDPVEEQESFEHRYNPLTTKMLVYSTVMSCLSSFFFGFHTTSMEILKPLFSGETATAPFEMTDKMWSSLSSVIFLGAIIGNIFTVFLNINLKLCMFVNIFIFFIGHVFVMDTSNYYIMACGRLIIGIACGTSCATVPSYLGYLAPRHMRGTVGSAHQLFIVIGVLTGQLVSYFIRDNQIINIFYRGFIVLYIIALVLLTAIKNVRRVTTGRSKSVWDLLKCREARKSLKLDMAFHIGQQATGINAILLFSNEILKKGMKDPQLGTISLGACSIVSTIVSMCIVDKFGRKPMILISTFLILIALLMLTTGRLVLTSLYIHIIGYAIGIGPITWFIINEIFRDEYKKAASALSMTVNWISAFTATFSFSFMIIYMGNLCFLVYFVLMIVFLFIVLLSFAETKGRRSEFQ